MFLRCCSNLMSNSIDIVMNIVDAYKKMQRPTFQLKPLMSFDEQLHDSVRCIFWIYCIINITSSHDGGNGLKSSLLNSNIVWSSSQCIQASSAASQDRDSQEKTFGTAAEKCIALDTPFHSHRQAISFCETAIESTTTFAWQLSTTVLSRGSTR